MIKPDTKWVIYLLRDPRNNAVRYVGFSTDKDHRYQVHLAKARRDTTNHHNSNWIRQLFRENLSPIQEIIEHGMGDGWQERERFWIRFYRESGYKLTNGTDGGDGRPGCVRSESERQASRKTHLKNLEDPIKRAKYIERAKILQDPSVYEKRCAMVTAALNRPEVKEKMSKARKGKKRSQEVRDKISRGRIGLIPTDQAKKNIGEGGKRRYQQPGERKRQSIRIRKAWARIWGRPLTRINLFKNASS